MRRFACLFVLLPVLSLASGQDEFLAARKKFKVAFVSTPQILKEMTTSEAYLELNGKVAGSIKGVDGAVSIIVKFGDSSQIVEAKAAPEWLEFGGTDVRLIVKATKTELQLTPTLELVASLQEDEAAMLDEKLAIQAQRNNDAARQKAEIDRINRELAQQNQSRGGFDRVDNPITGNIGGGTAISSQLAAIVPDYMGIILQLNKNVTAKEAQLIAECVIAYSSHYGVDARLVMALIQHESNFNPRSTSNKGAQGLGQLMPDTARGLGITDPYDIEQNVYGTVRTLRGHLERQSKEAKDVSDLLVRALSAYNAGPGAVDKYDGMPPYAETQAYVQRVIKTYLKLSGKS